MSWICPRCGSCNAESGQDGDRIVGVECACGLTRCGWLTGSTQYEYPAEGGFVQVEACKTVVFRGPASDPNEYTSTEEAEVVAEMDGRRFDVVYVPRKP
jgi:hypothetical protein